MTAPESREPSAEELRALERDLDAFASAIYSAHRHKSEECERLRQRAEEAEEQLRLATISEALSEAEANDLRAKHAALRDEVIESILYDQPKPDELVRRLRAERDQEGATPPAARP